MSPRRQPWAYEGPNEPSPFRGGTIEEKSVSHSLTKLLFHCVFSTKGRRALLKGEVSDKINAYMAGIARNQNAHLIRAGGMPDHRHLLLELPPTTNVCDAIRLIKTNSSKWLHQNYPECGEFGWQQGYAAFTVSESARGRVIEYIDHQQEPHERSSFQEELTALLRRHGVELTQSDAAE